MLFQHNSTARGTFSDLECVQFEVVPKQSENTLNVPVVVPLLPGCVPGSRLVLVRFALRNNENVVQICAKCCYFEVIYVQNGASWEG